jgi:hypothetical protein
MWMIILSMTPTYNQTIDGEEGMETNWATKGFWTRVLEASYGWQYQNTISFCQIFSRYFKQFIIWFI